MNCAKCAPTVCACEWQFESGPRRGPNLEACLRSGTASHHINPNPSELLIAVSSRSFNRSFVAYSLGVRCEGPTLLIHEGSVRWRGKRNRRGGRLRLAVGGCGRRDAVDRRSGSSRWLKHVCAVGKRSESGPFRVIMNVIVLRPLIGTRSDPAPTFAPDRPAALHASRGSLQRTADRACTEE